MLLPTFEVSLKLSSEFPRVEERPRWQIFGDGEYKADERFERNSHDSCVASVGVSDCYLVHTTRRLASEPPGIFPIPGLGPVQSVAIRRFDTSELSVISSAPSAGLISMRPIASCALAVPATLQCACRSCVARKMDGVQPLNPGVSYTTLAWRMQ